MRELAVTQAILEVCAERAAGARVLRITVEIGTLCCVRPVSLHFCFAATAASCGLADAELEVVRVFARSQCRECGAEVQMESLLTRCRCGSANLDPPQGGDRVVIRSMELEQDTAEGPQVYDVRMFH